MIRPATPEDAAALTEIYNYYIENTCVTFETEPLSREQMRRRIEEISAEGPYFVHESGGCADGYCYAHRLGQRAAYEGSMELSLYLAPSSTGKGIGSELMGKMIEECRTRGYRALFCLVTDDNEASVLQVRFREGRLPESRRNEIRQTARSRLLRTFAVAAEVLV